MEKLFCGMERSVGRSLGGGGVELERAVQLDSMSQPLQVIVPRNINGAELFRGSIEHLSIEQLEAPALEMLEQMSQSGLGGIVRTVEHGFSCKKTADLNPIDASNQGIVFPAFDTMSVPCLVESRVGANKFLGNPSLFPSRRW